MSKPRAVYITTPIYYVNDVPHIGHTYTTVVADTLARFHRLRGDEVFFLTGTDEHGQKMQRAAESRGISPLALADEVVENYKQVWPALGINYDDFIRTTEDRHRRGVYALFERIREREPEAIYKGTYTGLYCTGCESFYAANQVVDGRCPDQGHPVEPVEEESWFFRLSSYQERLLKLFDEHPEFVLPTSRLNEVRGFVSDGLRDLSISRSREQVSWGIPFPGDEQQVIYVWFDALANYVTALGFGSDGAQPLFDRFWTGGGTQLHLIGKDILRFHAVYWPAFLMAAGLPLPTSVFAHGWWLRDEAKMSKTRGNVVRPGDLLRDFGADAVRWFLLREISLGLDGSFSDEALIERANADLANNVGNLFSRVVTLVARNESGVIPECDPLPDSDLDSESEAARERYRSAFEAHDPSGALRAITEAADSLNRYLVRHEPWRRGGREETCRRVLRSACGELAHLALRIAPAMPFAGARLLATVGLPDDLPELRRLSGARDLLSVRSWPVGGRSVTAGGAVFPRIDMKEALSGATPGPEVDRRAARQREKARGRAAEKTVTIGIDEFSKIDLRTAKIVVAERHPKADRLLRIEVELGGERRQLVAGIAGAYEPEALVGRTVVVVANLAPATLRGVESQGMLLAATDEDGTPRLLTVDGDVSTGSKVT
jgi:methionyl-tRNA synthetase